MLETHGLRKAFSSGHDRVVAVDGVDGGDGVGGIHGVDLRLEPGQKALLLGPNGAGKSTLLRLLSGLLRPDGGAIYVAGYDVVRQRRRATSHVGYVGHASLLYRDLSVEENLRLFAGLYGLPARDSRARADRLLDELGLLVRRHERVRALSHGQRQRLALARAFLHDPPLLLLDEPFAALDATGRAWLTARLAGDAERTVLLATHQLDFAPTAADRVFELDGGRLRDATAGRPRAPLYPVSCLTSGQERPHPPLVSEPVAPAGTYGPSAWPAVRLLTGKDLRIEWRSRLRLQSLALFGAVLAVVAGSGIRGQPDLPATLPVVVWLLVVFLQLLFLGQLYQAETEDGGFDALRLAPVQRRAIALAKTATGALLAGGAGLVALVLLARVLGSGLPILPGVLALLALETVGMAAAGSLLFAATAAGEEPALDLYAIALLLTAPLIAIGQAATRRLFSGEPPEAIGVAFVLQGAYAIGLVAIAALAYGDFAERPPAPAHPS